MTFLTRNPAAARLRFGVVSIVYTLVLSIRILKQRKEGVFPKSRSQLRETAGRRKKNNTSCISLTEFVQRVNLLRL